jgi:hypothetical protein
MLGRKSVKVEFSKESLDSFLNSAMNIEYVYIILLGIKNLTSKSGLKEKDRKIEITNEKGISKVKFFDVDIKNKEMWDVMLNESSILQS